MARRWKKIVSLTLLTIVCVLALAITLTIGWRPIIGARARSLTNRQFERTPAREARGRYLAENVMACFDCHSEKNWNAPGAPPVEGKAGAGRDWSAEGLPWLVTSNITPDLSTGAGAWTDDQLARAIREGIGHDGRALFPVMPYMIYRELSDEDLASLIVYLRTLAPVRNALPQTQVPFPLSRLIQDAPRPLTAVVPPHDAADRAKHGEYLVKMSGCASCHTAQDKGQPLPGLEFAGGYKLKYPGGEIISANITPHSTGIAYYDEQLFLDVMRTGHVRARSLNSVMPWVFYRGMTDEDLKAIYAYLRALWPVNHAVDNVEPPTACKLCKQRHGSGERN
ncbi:MAG TPA: cytochrome c [Pyrinomonadaceae bacterium]|jgi:mono/diheme cytochrome c family protein